MGGCCAARNKIEPTVESTMSPTREPSYKPSVAPTGVGKYPPKGVLSSHHAAVFAVVEDAIGPSFKAADPSEFDETVGALRHHLPPASNPVAHTPKDMDGLLNEELIALAFHALRGKVAVREEDKEKKEGDELVVEAEGGEEIEWGEEIGPKTALLIYKLIQANNKLHDEGKALRSLKHPVVFCPDGVSVDTALNYVGKSLDDDLELSATAVTGGQYFPVSHLALPSSGLATMVDVHKHAGELRETAMLSTQATETLRSVARQMGSDITALQPLRDVLTWMRIQNDEKVGWSKVIAKWAGFGPKGTLALQRLGYPALQSLPVGKTWTSMFDPLAGAVSDEVERYKEVQDN